MSTSRPVPPTAERRGSPGHPGPALLVAVRLFQLVLLAAGLAGLGAVGLGILWAVSGSHGDAWDGLEVVLGLVLAGLGGVLTTTAVVVLVVTTRALRRWTDGGSARRLVTPGLVAAVAGGLVSWSSLVEARSVLLALVPAAVACSGLVVSVLAARDDPS